MRFIVSLLMSYKDVKCKQKEIQNSFLKLKTCLFLLFVCLLFYSCGNIGLNQFVSMLRPSIYFLCDFLFTKCKDELL